MDTALGLLAVIALVAVNAFFVTLEFALVAVDRGRVDRLAAGGNRTAGLLQRALRRLSFHLSGAQLGITITSLVLGFIAEPTIATVIEPALEPIFGSGSSRGVSIALALALATLFQMVAGELIPKNAAIARPERTALLTARPATIYGIVFGPVIRWLNNAANWSVRRFGIDPQEELVSVRSLEELEVLIQSSGEEGTLDEGAFMLLTRTLRFGEKTAADALVPRVDVSAVTPDETLADLVTLSARTGYSRFPVCRDDPDDIVGVVHVKDVAAIEPAQRATTSIGTIMAEPFVVPETRALGSLLAELRSAGSHLAVVVDEYGGTAGVITLEDVLEEIVGEIADEYDPAPPALTTVQPEGTWMLPGTLHPDEVADAAGFEVPDGPYETLAGFVLDRLGHIPAAGESFQHDSWRVEVAEMDRRRVATVKLVAPGSDRP